jgi:predicted HD phosphohydrolase
VTPFDVADQLIALVEEMAELPYGGELIDQRAHALQCALLAEGGSDELVAAALLHDVGYSRPVREQFPKLPHEESAARFLRPLLGDVVAGLVAAHVSAKRYLVRVDAGYLALLSAASISSLRAQGGPASDEEVGRWESLPWWPDAVSLRKFDDEAKVVGAPTPTVAAYRPVLVRLAEATTGTQSSP